MSPRKPLVIRCDLPTPDVIGLNHRRYGILLFVDERVPEDRVEAMLAVIGRRVDLHPERLSRAQVVYLDEVRGELEAALGGLLPQPS